MLPSLKSIDLRVVVGPHVSVGGMIGDVCKYIHGVYGAVPLTSAGSPWMNGAIVLSENDSTPAERLVIREILEAGR